MKLKNLPLSLKVGGGIILMMILIATVAPLVAPFEPQHLDLETRLVAPNSIHLFGTDQNGVDIFSAILFGARISLLIAICVAALTVTLGVLVGSIAGFLGGWWDMLLMRTVDLIFGFPGFLLVLSIVAFMQEASIKNMVIALSCTGWASYARLVRGEVLHLKEREHVLSAKSLGAPWWRLLIVHIWPNLLGTLMVQVSFSMAVTIITESSLSFLGLGVSPMTPTWGSLLNSGRQYLIEAPHLSLFPGLFIMLLVLGFNLLGDGLRDLLDPKKSA